MKKKVEVDLTSLLDVILIILFAVMIQMNSDTLQAKEETEVLNQQSVEQQENLSKVMLENSFNMQKIDQLNQHINQLEELVHDDEVTENISKYEAVMNKFVFVDLSVANMDGDVKTVKLLLNGKDTGLFILSEDWYDITIRAGKIDVIYELIVAHLETIEGGTPLILITYQHDLGVYRYVTNVIEAAMLKVQETYGNETTLITESILDE